MKEKDLLDVIEEVYDDYDIRLSEAFQQARDQFHVCQKNRLCILDNRLTEDELEKTRLSRYETISVIPLCFYNEVKSLPAGKRKWYEVKIPYWFARKYARMEDGLLFCDLKYDRNLGAFLKEDQGPLFL
jgi:CRISPR-associated endonuclease/helicase Cas3